MAVLGGVQTVLGHGTVLGHKKNLMEFIKLRHQKIYSPLLPSRGVVKGRGEVAEFENVGEFLHFF